MGKIKFILKEYVPIWLPVVVILFISTFAAWAITESIEDAGGLRQVVVDIGREIKFIIQDITNN